MDLNDVVRSCIRRWYFVIPIIAIAGWYAHSYYTSIQPAYYSNAVVGAAPSQQVDYSPTGVPQARNGLLEIGGAALVMNMAVLGLDDPSIRAQVVTAGGMGNFRVRMFPTASGSGVQPPLPLLMIEAEGPDRGLTSRTVELAAMQADSVLQGIQRQAGVPDAALLKAVMVTKPTVIAGMPSRTKVLVVILLTGASLAVLAAIGVDALMRWLRKRSRENRPVNDQTSDTNDYGARQTRSTVGAGSSKHKSQNVTVPTSNFSASPPTPASSHYRHQRHQPDLPT